MIKYMIENLATRIFIVGNLADKGLEHQKNTMKFVWSAISNKIDQQVHFQTHFEIEDDSEGVFVLENLNFRPEEWGFRAHEEPPKKEDEKKEGEGDAEQEPPEVDDKNKKLPPKDAKKKAEEEAKKKAEEEAKRKAEEDAAKAHEAEGEGHHEGEGEFEQEIEEPPVTYKEIEAFKNQLAHLGDVYVNDALDASLTHSNTVADLRSSSKVMGIRMTEEVRKLGMFFKYEYSPTICVLGGALRNMNVFDRLLLFNSLLHCTNSIAVMGGFALYFLKSLGVKLGPQNNLIDDRVLPL